MPRAFYAKTRRLENLALDAADFTLHTNVLLEKQFMQNSIFYINATTICSREEGSFDKDFIVDSGSLLEVKAAEVQAVFRLTPYFAINEDKRISVFQLIGNMRRKKNFGETLHNQDRNLTNVALRPDNQFVCELLSELCLNIQGWEKCDGQEEGFYNITEPLRKQFEGLRDVYNILFQNLQHKATALHSMQTIGKIEITCMKCKVLISTHEYTALSAVDKKFVNNFTMH